LSGDVTHLALQEKSYAYLVF